MHLNLKWIERTNIVWYTTASSPNWQTVKLFNGFRVSFSFRINLLTTGVVAEGLSFVVRGDSQSVGSAGNGLGYSGINRCIAIEFDAKQDVSLSDPAFNHISLHVNNLNPTGANSASESFSQAVSADANMNFANGSIEIYE